MENEIICLDTSILVEFYRKKLKEKSTFFGLTKTYKLFAVPVITQYELLIGADPDQIAYWNDFLKE